MKLIERKKYLNTLIDVINTPDIKVITGVRRSGKSKLLDAFYDYLTTLNNVNIIRIKLNLKKYEKLLNPEELYKYIDKIVAGEDAMKPDLESFKLAIGNTNKEDCLMVGDSIKSDKIGAENAGIDYYIVDKEHSIKDLLINIKNKDKTKKLIKNK